MSFWTRLMQKACIVATLNSHRGLVNCVKWAQCEKPGLKGNQVLVSASADASICLWKWNGEIGKKLATLKVCTSGVTSIAVHVISFTDAVLSFHIIACTASPEAKIFRCRIFEDDSVEWDVIPVVQSATAIHHSAAVVPVPNHADKQLLALGGTDAIIRLFIWDGIEAKMVCKLGGHNDWIRGLDFRSVPNSKILLASASQDRFVRVWALTTEATEHNRPLEQLAPSKRFGVGNVQYTVKLEGLLTGHEDRVHSIQFHPDFSKFPTDRYSLSDDDFRLQLLSASMDRTMIIWQWDEEHRCWEQIDSVGDAGHNSLGYFGGIYSPNGNSIVAYSFTGALHMWQKKEEGWMPISSSTGHYGPVMDMCLSHCPSSVTSDGFVYLLSVGKDQTTRLWMVRDGRLQEIARPQVHGHDFHAVSVIPNRPLETFITCSEEKVIRVFSAAINFYRYLQTNGLADVSQVALEEHVAYGASIKALALTNTAVYEGDSVLSEEPVMQGVLETYTPGPDFAPNATPGCITGPPLEEHLSQNTLWPEIQKLYGHGDVVYSLATSPCGQWLTSACKAQKEDTAVIFVWNTTTWKPHQVLRGHNLTVTRMAFSSNGRYLLSGSRDRTFCLFENRDGEFRLLVRKTKAHGRIIWDVSWAADDMHFATASRDQSIKIWRLSNVECICQISLESGVTAIAFYPNKDIDFLAAGSENGEINIWSIDPKSDRVCIKRWCTNENNRHVDAVHRLLWIEKGRNDNRSTLLASCSSDHSVRLFRIGHDTQ